MSTQTLHCHWQVAEFKTSNTTNTKLKARHRLERPPRENVPDRVRERVAILLRSKGHDVPPRRLGHGS